MVYGVITIASQGSKCYTHTHTFFDIYLCMCMFVWVCMYHGAHVEVREQF